MNSFIPVVCLLLIAVFSAICTFFVTASVATLFFALLILGIGLVFSSVAGRSTGKARIVGLFCAVFSLYVFLAINHYLGYQADWAGFTQDWRDEYKFYLMAAENESLSLREIFEKCLIDRSYLEYGGYVFYISALSSMAHNWFDGNHLLLQFLGTAVFGSLTSVMIFKIAALYVGDKKAFWYSLAFMLLSIFVVYSYSLLRDVPIAFLYSWGFCLALKPQRDKAYTDIALMLLINAVIWELRFEHGLFFSIITLYLCYKVFRGNALALVLLGIASLSLFLVIFFSYVSEAMSALDNYSKFTLDKTGEKDDSFARYIYQLPPVAKHIGILINSQIQPFPSWGGVQNATNYHQVISGLFQVVSTYFWFIVFFSLMYWLLIQRRYRDLTAELKVLSGICLVFLLLNTANMTSRRIMSIYPFVYIVYVYLLDGVVDRRAAIRVSALASCVYIFMVLIYLLAKAL
ncbi:hypothetical protein [Halopseudomonas bauzanensis]|uniref:hypothetical protein n=1 Tax=Halopseudomonas bauzanensis TaxID=653930 RepID=UPI0025544952|nr:hypothetical protein [Halopseudomonas bauzanensis]